jgi:hypothetical protein
MFTGQQHKTNRGAIVIGCAVLTLATLNGLRVEHNTKSESSATPESDNVTSAPDHKVYPKPPLPALPRAGGKFHDPTFGTEIMRATDERDDKVGVSTFYSHWPTFNCDNTYILARKASGAALIKSFDARTFLVGAGFQPGPVNVPGKGDVSLNFESAIWHPTDPSLIYCFTGYRDGGMHLYTYNVVTRRYTLVEDFSSLGGSDDYLWRMTMSADGDVFAWSQFRVGRGEENPIYLLIWRKSTDRVLNHMPTNGILEKIGLDKTGRYASIAYKSKQADMTYAAYLTVATGHLENLKWNSSDSPAGHGDMGTGFSAGFDNWACGINRRWLNNVHAPQTVFRLTDEHGTVDWTMDLHATLLADNEDWITIGTYREPSSTFPSTGVFRDEIFQVALDGSGRVRRICHTRSSIDNKTDTTGYWAMPKPTISTDGRFIAFTSNWEKSGRYDLFIARIDPAPRLSMPQPATAPGGSPQKMIRQRRVTQSGAPERPRTQN